MSSKPRIGFVGTGVMGASMAGHLLDAGYPLGLHTRTRGKAKTLLDAGAQWSVSPARLAADCEVLITMVGYPSDVESVYLGPDGLFRSARPGSLFIDMTTSSPELARRLGERAGQLGCEALDAPVSGGDVGAREARLSIMVGGSPDAFERARPLFEIMGKTILHQGPNGCGQFCKMANQIAIASGMLGVCESLAYADRAGLDPERVLASITTGAAGSWSLQNLAPRMLEGDFAPGFYVRHFLKDLEIALESARQMNLPLPGLELAESLYRKLSDKGRADEGTQALYRLYS